MSLTYATLTDYTRVQRLTSAPGATIAIGLDDTGKRTIRSYLARATSIIDGTTRRHFFPYYETRAFQVPQDFFELSRRALYRADLEFDDDLLAATRVLVGGGARIATAVTLTANADAYTSVLDVSDGTAFAVDNMVLVGNERMIVSAITGNALTVERGVIQTQASAHASGAAVSKLNLTQLVPGASYFVLPINTQPAYGARVMFPQTWAGAFASNANFLEAPQIYVTGWWGYHRQYKQAWAWTGEALLSTLTASATTFVVNDADGIDVNGETRFEEGNLIQIDDELLAVTATNTATNTLTVLRAQQGTVATAHATGARVNRWRVLDEVAEACVAITRTLYQSDQSVGGRAGIGEGQVSFAIGMPEDTRATLKRLARPL